MPETPPENTGQNNTKSAPPQSDVIIIDEDTHLTSNLSIANTITTPSLTTPKTSLIPIVTSNTTAVTSTGSPQPTIAKFPVDTPPSKDFAVPLKRKRGRPSLKTSPSRNVENSQSKTPSTRGGRGRGGGHGRGGRRKSVPKKSTGNCYICLSGVFNYLIDVVLSPPDPPVISSTPNLPVSCTTAGSHIQSSGITGSFSVSPVPLGSPIQTSGITRLITVSPTVAGTPISSLTGPRSSMASLNMNSLILTVPSPPLAKQLVNSLPISQSSRVIQCIVNPMLQNSSLFQLQLNSQEIARQMTSLVALNTTNSGWTTQSINTSASTTLPTTPVTLSTAVTSSQTMSSSLPSTKRTSRKLRTETPGHKKRSRKKGEAPVKKSKCSDIQGSVSSGSVAERLENVQKLELLVQSTSLTAEVSDASSDTDSASINTTSDTVATSSSTVQYSTVATTKMTINSSDVTSNADIVQQTPMETGSKSLDDSCLMEPASNIPDISTNEQQKAPSNSREGPLSSLKETINITSQGIGEPMNIEDVSRITLSSKNYIVPKLSSLAAYVVSSSGKNTHLEHPAPSGTHLPAVIPSTPTQQEEGIDSPRYGTPIGILKHTSQFDTPLSLAKVVVIAMFVVIG